MMEQFIEENFVLIIIAIIIFGILFYQCWNRKNLSHIETLAKPPVACDQPNVEYIKRDILGRGAVLNGEQRQHVMDFLKNCDTNKNNDNMGRQCSIIKLIHKAHIDDVPTWKTLCDYRPALNADPNLKYCHNQLLPDAECDLNRTMMATMPPSTTIAPTLPPVTTKIPETTVPVTNPPSTTIPETTVPVTSPPPTTIPETTPPPTPSDTTLVPVVAVVVPGDTNPPTVGIQNVVPSEPVGVAEESKSNLPLILGLGIGIPLCLIMAGIIGFLLWKRYKKDKLMRVKVEKGFVYPPNFSEGVFHNIEEVKPFIPLEQNQLGHIVKINKPSKQHISITNSNNDEIPPPPPTYDNKNSLSVEEGFVNKKNPPIKMSAKFVSPDKLTAKLTQTTGSQYGALPMTANPTKSMIPPSSTPLHLVRRWTGQSPLQTHSQSFIPSIELSNNNRKKLRKK